MDRRIAIFCLCLSLAGWGLLPARGLAQCPVESTAFNVGERLTYDLYFNWKFVWIKCGAAYYTIKSDTYKGKPSLRNDLLFTTNKKFDAFFTMRDTLVCQTTPQLVPLYFRKGAQEGKRFTIDEVWYSYAGGQSHVRQKYFNRHGEWSERKNESAECLYDMLSMLLRARSFNAADYKEGQRIHFPMVTGTSAKQQTLVYKGKKKIKANDDHTYQCLVFALIDDEDKKQKKELLSFFVTDDSRHIPIRIDFNLKFGTAKAYYAKGEGLK